MSHRSIWLHALPFHAGAWILLFLFFYLWPSTQQGISAGTWGLFFIFIACISFPHVMAMQTVYRKSS
jgi:hypothetical protein